MIRLYVYCEGQTEETFVKRFLAPYLLEHDVITIPMLCNMKSKHSEKGGIKNYSKVRNELRDLCYGHRNEFVTTMLTSMPSLLKVRNARKMPTFASARSLYRRTSAVTT